MVMLSEPFDPNAQNGSNFDLVPDGEYSVELIGAEEFTQTLVIVAVSN